MIHHEDLNHKVEAVQIGQPLILTKNHENSGYVPVFDGERYIGLLDVHGLQAGESLDINQADLLNPSSIQEDSTWFEVINLMRDQDLEQLVVLDKELQYQGLVGAENVVEAISNWAFIKEWGGILILENAVKQYSAGEIARIVEGENLRLTALFLMDFNEEQFRALIKVNHDDLSSLSDTFKRHGYRVVFRRFTEKMNEHIKERYDQLMKYLDI